MQGLFFLLMKFLRSYAKHIADGRRKAKLSTVWNRLDQCMHCIHSNEELVACMACGCPLLRKVSMASESCPLAKPRWLPEK
jgi:hypothetical protein